MHVQLADYVRLPDEHGRQTLHYPGEVVNIKNKKEAWRLIKAKKAVSMTAVAEDLPQSTGVVMRKGGLVPAWIQAMGVHVRVGEPQIGWDYTLIWNPQRRPRSQDVVVTFATMSRWGWEVAAPIYHYDKLAHTVSTKEERAITKEVIHELHVPFYETGMVFLKKSPGAEALMRVWRREMNGHDERLAFMRALYETKPMFLALPMEWVVRG